MLGGGAVTGTGLCIHIHSDNVGVQLGVLYGCSEHTFLHST
jgi:hypothetical protein